MQRLVKTCFTKPGCAESSINLVETCSAKQEVTQLLGNQDLSFWLAVTCPPRLAKPAVAHMLENVFTCLDLFGLARPSQQ